MDNLKFTAKMTPVEIEGTSDEQKKQNCLVVQTYTRNSINYKMTIINLNSVQFPEVFITPKMAIESIIKHVSQGPAYTYDEKTDIIEIKYKMFDTYGICLHLKKDLTQMPTIEQRITRLELLLDALTLDELIESHTYPEWQTYEEFMKLPSYKYFDAFHNAQRYFNSEPMIHLGKFRDIYYVPQISSMYSTRTQQAAEKAQQMQAKIESLTYISNAVKSKIKNKDPLIKYLQESHEKGNKNILDKVKGLGEKRKKALLLHFGSIDSIKNASLNDIANVDGIGLKIAKMIFDNKI